MSDPPKNPVKGTRSLTNQALALAKHFYERSRFSELPPAIQANSLPILGFLGLGGSYVYHNLPERSRQHVNDAIDHILGILQNDQNYGANVTTDAGRRILIQQVRAEVDDAVRAGMLTRREGTDVNKLMSRGIEEEMYTRDYEAFTGELARTREEDDLRRKNIKWARFSPRWGKYDHPVDRKTRRAAQSGRTYDPRKPWMGSRFEAGFKKYLVLAAQEEAKDEHEKPGGVYELYMGRNAWYRKQRERIRKDELKKERMKRLGIERHSGESSDGGDDGKKDKPNRKDDKDGGGQGGKRKPGEDKDPNEDDDDDGDDHDLGGGATQPPRKKPKTDGKNGGGNGGKRKPGEGKEPNEDDHGDDNDLGGGVRESSKNPKVDQQYDWRKHGWRPHHRIHLEELDAGGWEQANDSNGETWVRRLVPGNALPATGRTPDGASPLPDDLPEEPARRPQVPWPAGAKPFPEDTAGAEEQYDQQGAPPPPYYQDQSFVDGRFEHVIALEPGTLEEGVPVAVWISHPYYWVTERPRVEQTQLTPNPRVTWHQAQEQAIEEAAQDRPPSPIPPLEIERPISPTQASREEHGSTWKRGYCEQDVLVEEWDQHLDEDTHVWAVEDWLESYQQHLDLAVGIPMPSRRMSAYEEDPSRPLRWCYLCKKLVKKSSYYTRHINSNEHKSKWGYTGKAPLTPATPTTPAFEAHTTTGTDAFGQPVRPPRTNTPPPPPTATGPRWSFRQRESIARMKAWWRADRPHKTLGDPIEWCSDGSVWFSSIDPIPRAPFSFEPEEADPFHNRGPRRTPSQRKRDQKKSGRPDPMQDNLRALGRMLNAQKQAQRKARRDIDDPTQDTLWALFRVLAPVSKPLSSDGLASDDIGRDNEEGGGDEDGLDIGINSGEEEVPDVGMNPVDEGGEQDKENDKGGEQEEPENWDLYKPLTPPGNESAAPENQNIFSRAQNQQQQDQQMDDDSEEWSLSSLPHWKDVVDDDLNDDGGGTNLFASPPSSRTPSRGRTTSTGSLAPTKPSRARVEQELRYLFGRERQWSVEELNHLTDPTWTVTVIWDVLNKIGEEFGNGRRRLRPNEDTSSPAADDASGDALRERATDDVRTLLATGGLWNVTDLRERTGHSGKLIQDVLKEVGMEKGSTRFKRRWRLRTEEDALKPRMSPEERQALVYRIGAKVAREHARENQGVPPEVAHRQRVTEDLRRAFARRPEWTVTQLKRETYHRREEIQEVLDETAEEVAVKGSFLHFWRSKKEEAGKPWADEGAPRAPAPSLGLRRDPSRGRPNTSRERLVAGRVGSRARENTEGALPGANSRSPPRDPSRGRSNTSREGYRIMGLEDFVGRGASLYEENGQRATSRTPSRTGGAASRAPHYAPPTLSFSPAPFLYDPLGLARYAPAAPPEDPPRTRSSTRAPSQPPSRDPSRTHSNTSRVSGSHTSPTQPTPPSCHPQVVIPGRRSPPPPSTPTRRTPTRSISSTSSHNTPSPGIPTPRPGRPDRPSSFKRPLSSNTGAPGAKTGVASGTVAKTPVPGTPGGQRIIIPATPATRRGRPRRSPGSRNWKKGSVPAPPWSPERRSSRPGRFQERYPQ